MFVKILKGFQDASGALLAVIAVLLVLILLRLPAPLPTVGEVRAIKDAKARNQLMLQRPYIHVSGAVDVSDSEVTVKNTVDVNVENTVDVNVENAPLPVLALR